MIFLLRIKETVNSNIAPSEDDDTASQGYSIGDQFLKNGTLYKAKTAIVAGDTFVLDTNYEAADKITKQIEGKEDAPQKLVATLAAGATSLTFTDAAIKADSLVDGYSDPYGIVPTNATGTPGSILLTFDPQETATTITLLIR